MKKKNIYVSLFILLVCLLLVLIFGNKNHFTLTEEEKNIIKALKDNKYVTITCIINNIKDTHFMVNSDYVIYNSKEKNNLIINNSLANIKYTFSCDQVKIAPYILTEKETIYEKILLNNENIDVICIDVINQQKIYRNILSKTFTVYDKNNDESFIYFKDLENEYKPSCIEYQIIENES